MRAAGKFSNHSFTVQCAMSNCKVPWTADMTAKSKQALDVVRRGL